MIVQISILAVYFEALAIIFTYPFSVIGVVFFFSFEWVGLKLRCF